jgi:TolB-like protein
MRTLLKTLILAIAVLNLFTCRSIEDVNGSGDFTYVDYEPSLYFNKQSASSLRAAVLTFTSMSGGIAFFDAFVTDEVIRRLSTVKNLILVERSRIDLVMQEHSLAQSGIISSEDAAQLGKLLSVDHLVIGTYNYKDKIIWVRGRILDANSGKIQKAFGFRIPYTSSKRNIPVDDTIKPEKGCEKIQQPVLLALRDLSTPHAVKLAVDRAIEVPWEKPCGRIHRRVTSDFSYANLYPHRYHIFLAKTLESMERPKDKYYTIREIFSYFAQDGKITEFEWTAAREIMKRGWHQFHLKYFFKPERYNEVVIRRRASELLSLARKKEIGRPFAFSEYKIGRDLLIRPFFRTTEKGIAFSLFIIRSLHNPANAPSKEAKFFFGIITSCYKDTLIPEHRKKSLDLLIGFLKSRPPDRQYADSLWLFLHKIDEEIRDKRKRNPYIPYLPYSFADLKRINAELREYLCLRYKTGRGSYSEEELRDYLKRYKVRCSSKR